MVLPVQRQHWRSVRHPPHPRQGARQPGGRWEGRGDTSLTPVEIQQWLWLVGWEGTSHGSRRRGPAGVAQFRREEKSLVCRGGLAPLGSTAPLATVTLQPAITPPTLCPPKPPDTSRQSQAVPRRPLTPRCSAMVAVPAPPGRAPAQPHPIPPTPHLGFAPTVDEGADGVVGAGATHVEVGPVPGLDQADEVAALPLGSRGGGANASKGTGAPPFPLPASTPAGAGTTGSSPLAWGRSWGREKAGQGAGRVGGWHGARAGMGHGMGP